jgi:hypothetical protein
VTNIGNFDLTSVPSVRSEALATKLKARYSTWEDIVAASDEDLMALKGVTQTGAADLRRVAASQIKLSKSKQGKVAVAPEVEGVDSAAEFDLERLVRTELIVDKTTVLRDRVPTSPAVCELCGVDFIKQYGYRRWDKLPASTQEFLRAQAEQHASERHGAATLRVVTKTALKQAAKTKAEA